MYLESERQLWHVSLDTFFTSNSQNPKTGAFVTFFFFVHSKTPPTHKTKCFA